MCTFKECVLHLGCKFLLKLSSNRTGKLWSTEKYTRHCSMHSAVCNFLYKADNWHCISLSSQRHLIFYLGSREVELYWKSVIFESISVDSIVFNIKNIPSRIISNIRLFSHEINILLLLLQINTNIWLSSLAKVNASLARSLATPFPSRERGTTVVHISTLSLVNLRNVNNVLFRNN